MSKTIRFIYLVRHPEHGEATVIAEDRIQAVKDACRAWNIPWVPEGRNCTAVSKGEAEAKSRGNAK